MKPTVQLIPCNWYLTIVFCIQSFYVFILIFKKCQLTILPDTKRSKRFWRYRGSDEKASKFSKNLNYLCSELLIALLRFGEQTKNINMKFCAVCENIYLEFWLQSQNCDLQKRNKKTRKVLSWKQKTEAWTWYELWAEDENYDFIYKILFFFCFTSCFHGAQMLLFWFFGIPRNCEAAVVKRRCAFHFAPL